MRLLLPVLVLGLGVACTTDLQLRSSGDREDPFADGGDRSDEGTATDDGGDREFEPGDDTTSGGDDDDREFEPGDDGDVPGSDEDLCRTRGFWSNHADLWPTDTLALGDRTYVIDELLDLFDLSSNGDASVILAVQLVAAELNVAVGAPTDTNLLAAMDDAHAWLATHGDVLPYGVATSSAAGEQATALGAELDAFNNQECAP